MSAPTIKIRRTVGGLKVYQRLKKKRFESNYYVANQFEDRLFDTGQYATAVRWAKSRRLNGKSRPGEDCPKCPNRGWFTVRDHLGYPEIVQCEFCHTNPNSKFNREQQSKSKAA